MFFFRLICLLCSRESDVIEKFCWKLCETNDENEKDAKPIARHELFSLVLHFPALLTEMALEWAI